MIFYTLWWLMFRANDWNAAFAKPIWLCLHVAYVLCGLLQIGDTKFAHRYAPLSQWV